MAGFDRYMVFRLMYKAACASSDLMFRMKVCWMLEGMADPYWTRIEWTRYGWGFSGIIYYHILARKVGNLPMDLRRLMWHEELKIPRIYIFVPTRLDAMVTIGGIRMTQNQWVYREVRRVLDADRIALDNRNCSILNNPQSPLGLPAMLEVYRIMHSTEEPPVYRELAAYKFHSFQDMMIVNNS